MRLPMRRSVHPLLIALFLGFAASAATNGKRAPKRYSPEQFRASNNEFGTSFSPNEQQLLVSSDRSGIYNVYTVPVSGGALKPLTHSTTESTFGVSFFPKDERVLYTRDQGGNENNHLYLIQLDGTERDLTPGEELRATFKGWSHDLSSFYVATNERNP